MAPFCFHCYGAAVALSVLSLSGFGDYDDDNDDNDDDGDEDDEVAFSARHRSLLPIPCIIHQKVLTNDFSQAHNTIAHPSLRGSSLLLILHHQF